MKRKRFSIAQIVAIVKQAEMGLPVAELIRRVGISDKLADRSLDAYPVFNAASCPFNFATASLKSS